MDVSVGKGTLGANVEAIFKSCRDPLKVTTVTDSTEPEKRVRQARGAGAPMTLTPVFKVGLIVVCAIFVGSLFGMFGCSVMWEHPTDMQKSTYDTLLELVKLSAAALVGLIGGKAT